jgi:hypothetical protein
VTDELLHHWALHLLDEESVRFGSERAKLPELLKAQEARLAGERRKSDANAKQAADLLDGGKAGESYFWNPKPTYLSSGPRLTDWQELNMNSWRATAPASIASASTTSGGFAFAGLTAEPTMWRSWITIDEQEGVDQQGERHGTPICTDSSRRDPQRRVPQADGAEPEPAGAGYQRPPAADQ